MRALTFVREAPTLACRPLPALELRPSLRLIGTSRKMYLTKQEFVVEYSPLLGVGVLRQSIDQSER